MLIKTSLSNEVTRLLESGVMRQLNSGFFLSPLRFFMKKFIRNNPEKMDRARNMVRQDIEEVLAKIPNFRADYFVVDGEATENGKLFLKRIYNIGINLLKKHLTMRQAFSVITSSVARNQVYNFVLKSVEKAAIEFMNEGRISS